MTVVGIGSTAAQDGINAAVGALFGQIETVHTATHAITSAIFPPTNDSASGTAVVQELGNTAQFSAMLKLGLAQMASLCTVVTADNHTHMAADAAGAAAAAAVPVTRMA